MCVSLTHKDVTKHAAEISKQQQQQQLQTGTSGNDDSSSLKSEHSGVRDEDHLNRSPGQSEGQSQGQGQGQGSHVQDQDQRSGVNPPQCVGQKVERSLSLSVTSTSQITHSQTQERSSPGS